ncbi:hypothetical protein [Sphingobacterium bambusae]|uniref:SHOCT domain-containing protein n=1 Tax=Sphingobacterium bambusae TaxID=662858 RepID=A0ABW6BE60_9SPHI|nr:hypothetical protein [Sphingobacterium bambusae]WPL47479.1 hypothetical protein SCB77_16115 [Sphingobacterium bambusae]
MKYFLILLCTISSGNVIAQRLSVTDTLLYEKMVDKAQAKSFKNGMDVSVYIASDKNIYAEGDTLVLGKPIGEGKSAFSKKRNYEYIFYGKPAGAALTGIRNVEENFEGYKVTIEKIQLNKGALGLENYVFIYAKPLANTDFTILFDKHVTITMLDNAINKGEIKPLRSTRPLTRDEAVELLKKKKEEYDLDVISKEEYESFREKLVPLIRSSK